MMNYIFRLILSSLVSALGIGGGAGLLVFILFLVGKGDRLHATEYGLMALAAVGGVSAVLVICIMMPLDLLFRWFVAKQSGINDTAGILENVQVRELILYAPPKKIHFACRQALLAIPGVKNVHDDANNGRISASIGASWRCPGETVEVQLTKRRAEEYLLTCVSRPTLSKMVFDYGKNFENVELWKKRTLEFMKSGPAFS